MACARLRPLEGSRGLPPRQPPGPPRQKPHHRQGDRPLALTPGYMLHHHAVYGTLHPARRVQKIGLDAPQRHKQPGPLRQSVITRGSPTALRALTPNALVGFNADFNAQASPGAAQPHLLVNEAAKMLNPIQDCLNFQLHSWSSGLTGSIDLDIDWINRRPVFFYRRVSLPLRFEGSAGVQPENLRGLRIHRSTDDLPKSFWVPRKRHSGALGGCWGAVAPCRGRLLPTNSATEP